MATVPSPLISAAGSLKRAACPLQAAISMPQCLNATVAGRQAVYPNSY